MSIPKSEIRIEYMRGTGPGGQHRNKTNSACRITHIPTGLSAYADERSQKHSRTLAMKDLVQKLQGEKDAKLAQRKKSRRDHVIHNEERIRTYDYSRGVVTDHRSGKKASIKDIVIKGKLDLLRNAT